jgi:cell division initiation protein
MELTPNEMRNHQFSTAMRGFNKAEVGAFKESAATTLEAARTEILKLTEEKTQLEAKYNELKNLENTIKSAVMNSEKNAEQIVANARKEAELMISEAKHRRDMAIRDKYDEIAKLEAKVNEIAFARDSFYTKLRSEIESHLKLVNSIDPEKKQAEQTAQTRSEKPVKQYSEPTPQPQVETPTDHYSKPTPPPPSPTPEEPEPPQAEKQDNSYGNIPLDKSSSPEHTADETDKVKTQPEKSEKMSHPDRPSLNMQDDDINRVVDQFGEVETQEEEEVNSGQSQGKDF